MDKYRNIANLLRGTKSSNVILFTAQVIAVQDNACTILADGLQLSGVRLLPTTTQSRDRILITPMIGSYVLVGSMSGDYNNLVVLNCDTAMHLEVNVNGQNLMMLISQLIQTISTATIITPQGVGTFDPSVIAQLNTIESQFKLVFK